MSEPIPVGSAKALVEQCGLSGVLTIGFGDVASRDKHVTTYGASAADKVLTAMIGDAVQHVLESELSGWKVHADFRQEYDAALFREALELLTLVRNRQGCTGPMLQQAERILNAAGRGVRSGG
jgi:hypothetical protein